MWEWFYEIRGAGNRLVRRAGAFNTEQEAITAGTRYLQDNKAAVVRPDYPDEVFSVMTGQKLVRESQ
jgi:hypothetical protein